MLHAHLQVAQIMDLFEVRVSIHEFHQGLEPEVWHSVPQSLVLPDGWESEDALSTILRLIALWSEMTNSQPS